MSRTKLEEKLIELGYERAVLVEHSFKRKPFIDSMMIFVLDNTETRIEECKIVAISIKEQQDIDNLQQAFDEMQRDLEELRKCNIL